MTDGERAIWAAAYAASWHQSMGRGIYGTPTDVDRAKWCAEQADDALHSIKRAAMNFELVIAKEVLK